VLQLPSIIATLGTSSLFSGALVLGTGGANWVTDLPAAFTSLGQGGWGPISVPVLFAVVILPLVWLLSTQTSAGRRVMAVGSNSEAARLVGIRVKLVEGATFVLNGIFLGIGATLAVAYLGQAQTNLGAGITFTALTVAVVGGTDVFGGTGSVLGVTLAAVLIEMTDSALVFFHIDSLWAKALQGLFILMALAMSVAQHRRSRRPLRLPWVRGRKAADHA
ncbi:MAG: ABC transporter permease, partial [Propionicimonas sp.]|nr:ABC transporter permease [Propionicimonas sp.]